MIRALGRLFAIDVLAAAMGCTHVQSTRSMSRARSPGFPGIAIGPATRAASRPRGRCPVPAIPLHQLAMLSIDEIDMH